MINNYMLPSDDQPSKKKNNIRKKKTSLIKSTIKQIPPTPDSEVNRHIEDAIAQAFTRFYDAASIRQNKLKDLHNLDAIVSEYLQSFMILGYDINGEKVCISHAENASARDALIEHLRGTFFSIMNGNNEG